MLDTMKDYRDGTTNTPGVINKVKLIVKSEPALFEHFVALFLPEEFKDHSSTLTLSSTDRKNGSNL
jgi:histone deacetylase complex regulatory component SIN3